jgi:hypothetical protein
MEKPSSLKISSRARIFSGLIYNNARLFLKEFCRMNSSLTEEFTFRVKNVKSEFLDPESGSEMEEDINFVDKYDKTGHRI